MKVWKLLLPVASVLLALLLLEGSYRLLAGPERPPPPDTGFVVPDPDLLWKLAPRAGGRLATNELGFRDGPYDPDADVKILLLGDSVAWGHAVEMRESFPYVLQERLNAGSSGPVYEIVNASVPGYSTFQQLAQLEHSGLALEPDAIVLQFCLNDVVERYHALAEYGGQNVFLGIDTREGITGMRGFLLKHSRLYEAVTRFVVGFARDRQAYRVRQLSEPQLSPEIEDAWRTALLELDDIRRVAADNDVPLLLMIAPYAYQLAQPQRTRQPQQKLVAFAREGGTPVVDLLPAFARRAREVRGTAGGPIADTLFVDANHFSPEGHVLAAELLAEPVRHLVELAGLKELR